MHDVVENRVGPVHGFYIAGYCIATEGGHYAYAKLYREPPEHAWSGKPAVAKVSSGPWPLSADALSAATWRACTYAALLDQQASGATRAPDGR